MERMTSEGLFAEVKARLSLERIRKHVEVLNRYYRYTGTEQGETAARYITDQCREYGIDVEPYTYDAYLSLPLEARLEAGGNSYPALAAVYSGQAASLKGSLLSDPGPVEDSWQAKEERFRRMRGRVVLTSSGGGSFARQAADHGALAVIQMQTGPERQVHHTTIGSVWGTPVPGDQYRFPFIPYVSVNRETGELLQRQYEGKEVCLTVKVDTRVRTNTMPVARIPGKSPSFVLVSGHYDSWYEGITDNAVADGIMLEYARVFGALKEHLLRGVVIGWWSGHSDGRYSGSAWYCDHEFESLKRNCVAHVNLDLAGCRNAKQIRVRTTRMEGEQFTDPLVKKYTGLEPKPYIPMIRGADQSFWGVDIPIHIMLKYEALPEECSFNCPSGGAWWHSNEDTLDKMDCGITERDALFNGEMICSLANSPQLPVCLPEFLEEMKGFLVTLQKKLPGELEVDSLLTRIHETEQSVRSLLGVLGYEQRETDRIIKKLAGGLVRLTYSQGQPYGQDPAEPSRPFGGLWTAAGLDRLNTREDEFLFVCNYFNRQKNRIMDGLAQIMEEVDNQILRWRGEAEC